MIGRLTSQRHLSLVSTGRQVSATSQHRVPDPVRPAALLWSVDLSCRSGCLVAALGTAAPLRVFWAEVLLPLLQIFDGPVVLDLTRGKVNTTTIAALVGAGGAAKLTRRPRGELRMVAAPGDLARAQRALDGASVTIYRTLQDAIDPQKIGPPRRVIQRHVVTWMAAGRLPRTSLRGDDDFRPTPLTPPPTG